MKNNPVIGIIGGGQLGRMFIEEALRYNIECIIVDADKDCPASGIASHQIVGSISEEAPILRLGEKADILTYEIEHIYNQPLLELEKQGKKLIPSPRVLQIIQDKGLQKDFYSHHKIPTAPYVLVNKPDEWKLAVEKYKWKKFVAKSRKEGYDGRGVQFMSSNDLKSDKNIPFREPSILEALIDCRKEISIIVCRDQKGNIKMFPPVEMEFDPKANLVTMLICPAQISASLLKKAEGIAVKVVKAMNGTGIFAVEMFLSKINRWYVNEVAPRPHNSGHHTIEACYTSQFEQLLRILLDLPLGSTELIRPAVMINILGSKEFTGSYYLHGCNEALKIPGVYIHLYGKKESRPMRKLGHITILGKNIREAKRKANQVKRKISVQELKPVKGV
ncbi:MAG: 5-(carboxyamino)imidazole ribonucleotide synthase [Chitinophagales bacterium]|nr:5-(carboxyamino)imidazole ribonucleotide synthase [Chitinophagales bacterium]